MAADGGVEIDAGKCLSAVGASCDDFIGERGTRHLSLADTGTCGTGGRVFINQWNFYSDSDDREWIAGNSDLPAQMEVSVQFGVMHDTKYDSRDDTAFSVKYED